MFTLIQTTQSDRIPSDFTGESVDDRGNRYHWAKGQLHREDGPAVVEADGTVRYLVGGILHREDGPAVEWAISKYYPNGLREYYFRGVKVQKADLPRLRGDHCTGKIVEIDGQCYRLVKE